MNLKNWLPGILWGALLILSSCAETPVEDPNKHPQEGSYRTTLVTGRFEGFDSYQDWVVFLTGFNYRSVTYRVEPDGAFHINAVNIPAGRYILHFGKVREKSLGSMKIRIDSHRTHLGVIQAGQ